MSNIIKSFRVIEDSSKRIEKVENKDNDSRNIELRSEMIIEEAEKEAGKLLGQKKLEASKILEQAEETKNKLITDAKKEVENLIEEAEMESISIKKDSQQEGYEKGHLEGYNIGYEEGYTNGENKAGNIIEESLVIKEEYKKKKQNAIKEAEADIIKLVTNIYEKVLGQKLEHDENLIVELVANGIKNLDPTEKLTIITSEEDYDILQKHKARILAEASLIDKLEMKYDINLEKGDSILETPKGNVDLSIKKQMEEVKALINKILNNE